MYGDYDLDECKFKCSDYAANSILMKNEYVQSCTEFAPNNIIVFADLSQCLMVLKDWKVVHELSQMDPGNTEKFWQAPVPGFDVDDFPFVLCSGKVSYNLVNIKTGIMQPLIKGSAFNSKA